LLASKIGKVNSFFAKGILVENPHPQLVGERIWNGKPGPQLVGDIALINKGKIKILPLKE
jgi:hypothetical protein